MALWLGSTLFWNDVIHHSCILTVLWDTKHIKKSLIIWVDATKLVSCVFNAKCCLSSDCTISFYNLIICLAAWHAADLRWVPDETFLCSCFTTRAPAMDQEGGCLPHSELWHGEFLWSPSRKTCDNHKVRQEWYCMVNPDLCLSENFLILHVQDIREPIIAAHRKTGETRELHEGYLISLPHSLSN